MLYEASSQPKIFFYLLLSGFLAGFLLSFNKIISKKIIKNTFFKHIFDFFSYFFVFFYYFFTNLITNYGQLRFYGIFFFLLALSSQQFLFNKLFAKKWKKCYNESKGIIDEKKKT